QIDEIRHPGIVRLQPADGYQTVGTNESARTSPPTQPSTSQRPQRETVWHIESNTYSPAEHDHNHTSSAPHRNATQPSHTRRADVDIRLTDGTHIALELQHRVPPDPDRRQRLVTPGPSRGRSDAHDMADRDAGAPAHARLLAESRGDLLL